MIAVERSVQSTQSESFSAPITSTLLRGPGAHHVGGRADRVAEAGAGGVEVERGRRRDADAFGGLRGGVGDRVGHRAGRDDDGVDVGGGSPASFTARVPASAAMSTSGRSFGATRRLRMPTRSRIHSSLVSMVLARSSLETTCSGWVRAEPGPGDAGAARRRSVMPQPVQGRVVFGTACSAISRGFVEVVRGLERQGRDALELALHQADQGAGGRQLDHRGDAELLQRGHARVPADRPGDLRDEPAQRLGAAVDGGAVGVGQQRQHRVGGGDAAAWPRIASSAGAMKRVWNAPATGSGITRAFSGGCAASCVQRGDRTGRDDLPAPLRLAGSSPSSPEPGEHRRRDRRRARRNAGGLQRARCGHLTARGPRPARRRRPRSARPPSRRRPARRPSGPATGGRRAGPLASAGAAASSAAATTSGWVTAVSLISSASAVVPRRRRSRPMASDHPRQAARRRGSSSHGASMPGSGTLAGREECDHGAHPTLGGESV